ncbi:MAG: hypothetical protein K0R27_1713 [Xanthobacteraceae bacterium]|jgi:zinc resistance-associated protein|nr:hypothetical protein [Xanthobacteraceae bacterium]
MKQAIIAATAAALLASATFGIAATAPRSGDPQRERPSTAEIAENAAAFSDARIAALKAGLRMSADQEKLWPAVEQALRDLAQQRIDRRAERMEAFRERGRGERPDLLGTMRERADTLTQRGDGLKKLVDAADPLYASLDEAQKHRFDILLRHAQFGRFAEWGGPHRGGWRDHGPRREFRHHGPHRDGPGRDWHRGPRGGGGDDQGEERL